MSFWLDWKGEELREKIGKAEAAGIDATTDAAVELARGNHPGWKTQTGEAERSIKAEAAEKTSTGYRGAFGSTLPRFPFLELGARGRSGDHTLRRAGDIEGGHLAERIRSRID